MWHLACTVRGSLPGPANAIPSTHRGSHSWSFGEPWPTKGEINLVEGVNTDTTTSHVLHTSEDCTISSNLTQSGKSVYSNCNANAAGQPPNVGCLVQSQQPNSFGAGFNSNGGGVYAVDWTDHSLKMWFFPRGSIPADIEMKRPDPSKWGPPAASYAGQCDFRSRFKKHNIVRTSSASPPPPSFQVFQVFQVPHVLTCSPRSSDHKHHLLRRLGRDHVGQVRLRRRQVQPAVEDGAGAVRHVGRAESACVQGGVLGYQIHSRVPMRLSVRAGSERSKRRLGDQIGGKKVPGFIISGPPVLLFIYLWNLSPFLA